MLSKGIQGKHNITVTEEITAKNVRSGELPVLATPAMIALAERTAYESVSSYLEEGEGTVGTLINIKHLAPTPIGMTVECTSVLREIDGRRLVFDITVRDEKETVGVGVHERFVIKNERFMEKALSKKNI